MKSILKVTHLLVISCLLLQALALSVQQNVTDRSAGPFCMQCAAGSPPHAPNFHSDCVRAKFLTCHREQYKVLWHSHYIVGVDNYCFSPGSCWDVDNGMGRQGERFIAQLRAEHACTETFFRFHRGGKTNPNIERAIVAAGYDWVISFAAPVGCGTMQVKNILNRCGVPWENLPMQTLPMNISTTG